MPLLYHETILRSRIPSITLPSWWRQKVSKCSSKNNNSNNDDITGTTRDWRSLSPNNPPLPFVQDNDYNGTNPDIYPHTQASELAPKRLPIPKKYRHSSYDDGQLQKLSTIIEESDLLTEISPSPKNSNRPQHRHRHQQEEQEYGFIANIISQHNHDKNDDITVVPSPAVLPPNDSPHPSSTGSTSPALPSNESTSPTPSSFVESSSLTLPPFSNDPTTTTLAATTDMTFSSSSSAFSATSDSSSLSSPSLSLSPHDVWPIHIMKTIDTHFIPPTAEIKIKQEFISMIEMTYKCRQNHQSSMPSKMEILFDSQDNVHNLQIWMHDKIQSHIFKGDAQYIPPELPTRRTYNCDRVDVWILGISLYRMLVGKYPFQANNDRQLFSKMQCANLSIPSHLSTDAKDLLRRMLAPDHSRASLDLVMFHPWLKPYSVTIPAPLYDTKDLIDPSPPPLETTTTMDISSPRAIPGLGFSAPPAPSSPVRLSPTNHHHPSPMASQRKRSIVSKLKKVLVFIVKGPCPPPAHPYRDLSPPKSF